MRAFIVRPFGTQRGIDFDSVCANLIVPALAAAGIDGRTTLDILRAGNIRVDMFQRLITADLVIADLTIHNANVFYELGIRHAFRERRTLLVRANVDKWPFDLQTDRYFTYDLADLKTSRDLLVDAIEQSIGSKNVDSPVFQVLPIHEMRDRSILLAVPNDFQEDVERAVSERACGDLKLIAEEVQGLEWESEGLRAVGRAQMSLKCWSDARYAWEGVLKSDANDLEANISLGTIYHRLNDLVRSDLALRRVIADRRASNARRAEAFSLLARNNKTRWLSGLNALPMTERRAEALRSPYLMQALEEYDTAYSEDLSHYYSGINALALLTVLLELAATQTDVWSEKFDDDTLPANELQKYRRRATELGGAVTRSLSSVRAKTERLGKHDVWMEISEADRLMLTGLRPARVTAAYRAALVKASDFAVEAACAQLVIYERLGILTESVKAALTAFPPPVVAQVRSSSTGTTGKPSCKPRPRVLLFTGHRIDSATGRPCPRFPADMEQAVRRSIRDAVLEEKRIAGEAGIKGAIAGGASGGDILFHEVCAECGIATDVFLALPTDRFCRESVADSGSAWVERFHFLTRSRPVRVLAASEELPHWLSEKPNYGLWQRNNLWMLSNAIHAADGDVTLIALWDGTEGDGPGGTKDLVSHAERCGLKTIIISMKQIAGHSLVPQN